MKDKKIIAISIFLMIYTIFNNIILSSNIAIYSNLFITPISLLIICIIVYFLLPTSERRIRYKYEKNQNILIALFTYFIIYFLSGLIFGYEYSIYKKDLLSIIKNIYMFIIPIILQEYIRNKLIVNTKDNLINNSLISIIFIIININFNYLLNNIIDFSIGFKYISVELFPTIITSFIMTYISRIAGKKSTMIYRSFLKIIPIIVPIIPSLPWILTSILGILLPMFIYFNISYFDMLYSRRERRFSLNKDNSDIPLFLITIIFILFILKIFKYFPVAVLSDSMKDTFSRGDTLVIEKIDDNNLKNIKEYDIIYYKKDNKYIIHRIVDVKEENGKKVFITKGDNNKTEDEWKVYEEDILGIMKFSVPYTGYPAVWFNEMLNN